jgi:hypothetical protein
VVWCRSCAPAPPSRGRAGPSTWTPGRRPRCRDTDCAGRVANSGLCGKLKKLLKIYFSTCEKVSITLPCTDTREMFYILNEWKDCNTHKRKRPLDVYN